MINKAVIIVAGGSGSRMGLDIPKQFALLNGLPILMHTIRRFYDYDSKLSIIIVLSEIEINNWKNLIKQYSFSIPHLIATGGPTRFHSVKNGLELIKEHCIVAIHDGVRPLCTKDLIRRCFEEAEKYSNAIPAIRITETIRKVEQDKNYSIERDNFRIIQTPQCFDSDLLKKAYRNALSENFTDDAGVVELDGNIIHLIEGEKNNIKITRPEDLIVASVLEKKFFSKST